MSLELIGILAGVFTSLCGLPLVLYVHRTGYTRDLTYGWLGMLNGGVLLWCVYAILKPDVILLGANVICLALNSYLLYKKLGKEPFFSRQRKLITEEDSV